MNSPKNGGAGRSRYGLRRKLYTLRSLNNSPSSCNDKAATEAQEAVAQEMRQLREMVVRQRAEFENFRKRAQREKDNIREVAAESLLARLLPVLDNLDRALSSAETASDVKSVRDGVTMIATQLSRALQGEGLEQVKALHEPFDPALHDALGAEVRDDVPDGHIFEVLLPGYVYKTKLLRPAMVKVAKAPNG